MDPNKEALSKAIHTYDQAKGMNKALRDLADYFEKYFPKLERRENELKHKVERYKKSGKDVEAFKIAIHDFAIVSSQINAALKLQKEFLERLLESSNEVSSIGDEIFKTYHQNKE